MQGNLEKKVLFCELVLLRHDLPYHPIDVFFAVVIAILAARTDPELRFDLLVEKGMDLFFGCSLLFFQSRNL